MLAYIYIPYMWYMDPMGDIIWTCFFQKLVHWFTHTGWNRPLKIKLYSTHGRMYHQRGQRQRPKYLAFESFPWRKSWLFFLEVRLMCWANPFFSNRESMEFVVWLSWANPRIGWVSMMIGDVKEPMVGNDGDGKTRHPLDEIHPRRDQNSLRPNRQS